MTGNSKCKSIDFHLWATMITVIKDIRDEVASGRSPTSKHYESSEEIRQSFDWLMENQYIKHKGEIAAPKVTVSHRITCRYPCKYYY